MPALPSGTMTSVLLLVDVQRNMLLPPEPVPDAATVALAIETVLDKARHANAQVVHIRNTGGSGDPDEPGTDGWQLVHAVEPGEITVDKPEPNAFAGTDLADHIPADAHLIIVGMQSDHCVSATARAAVERGHAVTVVRGAHATYPGGGESAREIAERVDMELVRNGVVVTGERELNF